MTKYKVKYKSSTGLTLQYRKRILHVSLLWLGAAIVVAGVVFGCVRLGDVVEHPKKVVGKVDKKSEVVEYAVEEEPTNVFYSTRLNRDVIPDLDFRSVSYGRLFNDLNEEQLCAARRNGINRVASDELLATSSELVRIYSNSLYVIDSLTHSKPYLVPKAAIMLDYIGLRFQEVVKEMGKDNHDYRIVVTSVLRSQSDVNKLRRYNRNATENSCHCYGTTIDISYIRFLRDDGELINERWLKEALATALYELRYEGICYVKYEFRQCCFHITVRDTEYEGALASSMKSYDLDKLHGEKFVGNLHSPKDESEEICLSEYVQY